VIDSQKRLSTTDTSVAEAEDFEPAARAIATKGKMSLNERVLDEHLLEGILPGAPELFRGIYTRSATGLGEVLAICSATAGEGRTSIGLGLASTMAQDFPEREILLVEADLQYPVLANEFAVDQTPGLVECIRDGLPIQMGFRATPVDNLTLLPAGSPTRYQSRLLASSRMAVTVDTLRSSFDLTVIDTPPLLTNSDALVLADLADSVIMVVRAGVTPLHLVDKAIEQIDADRVRGVVLNGAHAATPSWLRRVLAF
jgi:capsular exopolysaccharide synthesis family protein